MTEYHYTPLSGTGQIRLLRLHAGTEAVGLSVDLIHTSLDKAPSFTALSYPWGDPQPRKAIRCSGLQAEIGPSLHMALQHLRKAHLDIFVWADALCINQEDIPERTQQVRIMSEIYAAASTTAIWLGEESDEVKMAFGWLRRFERVRVASEFDPLDSEYGFGLIHRSPAENMLQAAFGKHRGAAFGHLWALLSRPWFTRKWVIQELVKSRRPLMVVGRIPPLPWAVLAGWMNFVNFCPAVKNHFLAVCPRPQVLEAGTKILGMNMGRATILTQMEAMGKQVLLFLITRTLGFHCGDPRDHIFALLGIASDRDCFDHIIDYISPAEEIWRRLAYACISDSTSLKLLWSLVMFAPLNRRVHSWVPNLENVRVDGDGSILASQFTVQQARDYNTSGDSELQAHLDDGGKMLTIRGRIIDRLQLLGSDSRSFANSHTIKTIMDGSGHFSRESIQRMLRHRYRWLEECMAIANTTCTGSANGEEAFRDALLYDHLAFKEFPKDLELARSRFSTQIRLEKAMAYADDNYSFLVASMESMSLTSSLLLENLITDKVQRRFGRTEGGRIGWLPPVAEEGDFICIFDGMELPYVLRPAVHGQYLLVGECLIPGIMMGEAFSGLPGVGSEMIVLE
ncbi:heterokaryon incompatibility protein-domain-containing protein [Chaetomidium leptoderma]|uniref:Heterokaryon incompatibility protein-domain-containing protein n=1 Tax=Chaetomidium leptoderma TaxID=669021 RepID=A0AAN6VCE8_9PEZI|nr:heterokaryon incompatibility protein-domain-containing protein [Chaetomidium leptoderma]